MPRSLHLASPSPLLSRLGMAGLLSVFCMALALPAWAQTPEEAEPMPVFDGLVEVSEVFLDVLVSNADGEVIRGLTSEDFIVEENGEAITLSSTSFYTTRYGEDGTVDAQPDTGGGAQVDEIPWSRHFLFVFHTPWSLSFARTDLLRQRVRAGQAALKWVEEEMLPSDWVAVVGIGRNMTVYQDYTQNPKALRQALQDAATGRKLRPKTARRNPELDYDLHILRRIETDPRLRRSESDVYDALGLLSEASAYLVGRKNMLVFTIGLGEEGKPPPEDDPKLVAFETLLNDHNVAFYPIDITPAGRGTLESRQSEMLTRLAEATGGEYFQNFVGFSGPMSRVADENYAYYLLTYQSTHPSGERGYRRVEVRTRDESLKIRVRRGYRYGL